FWGNISGGAVALITTLNCSSAERISIAINAAAQFIRSAQTVLTVKDMLLFGTPSVSDLACNTATPSWDLVKPTFSGNAPKFGNMTVSAGGIKIGRASCREGVESSRRVWRCK